jgi:ABC-2 type transport system permease protein
VIALMVAVQLAIGVYVLDAAWPEAPASFVAALALGATAFAALGLAVTGLVRSAEGSSAVVNAVYLPMVFISGSFFSVESMPGFLQAIADVLPLTYLLDLVRSTFIDGEGLGGSPGAIGALAAWGAIGVAGALTSFRWEPREV